MTRTPIRWRRDRLDTLGEWICAFLAITGIPFLYLIILTMVRP